MTMADNELQVDKKRLQKLDLGVANRLILVVYENTREKRTNIARNSKMGYDKCVLFLDALEMMDFIKKDATGKHVMISLTVAGHKYCRKVLCKIQV